MAKPKSQSQAEWRARRKLKPFLAQIGVGDDLIHPELKRELEIAQSDLEAAKAEVLQRAETLSSIMEKVAGTLEDEALRVKVRAELQKQVNLRLPKH